MDITRDQLKAFEQIARLGTFTKAAEVLNLTQSALSHRIKHLEAQVQTSVFVRAGTRVKLTEAGQKLLRYCQIQNHLEAELLADVTGPSSSKHLFGRIRIAGVSSVMRSLILPALAEFCRNNTDIRLDFFVREIEELPKMLHSGEVDFIITTEKLNEPNLNETLLGYESNVLVQAADLQNVPDLFLDHDPADRTTYDFFRLQGKRNPKLLRSYLDDIYGLIDAVSLGMGKAILPKHLIKQNNKLRITKGLRSLEAPICLYDFDQPYYTKLRDAVVQALKAHLSEVIGTTPRSK